MVKNPPSNAGDAGLIPGRGTKIPHASGQLSPRATATELIGPTRERKPAHHNYREAHAPELERNLSRPHAVTKDPTCLNKDPVCHN